jgi:hypothetical protein
MEVYPAFPAAGAIFSRGSGPLSGYLGSDDFTVPGVLILRSGVHAPGARAPGAIFFVEAAMFVRFVFGQVYQRGRQRAGILRGAWRGSRSGPDPVLDRDAGEIHRWLNRRLVVPWEDVFSGGRGLCWCKTGAQEVIRKLRDLAVLLDLQGARIWEIHSRNPGLVTYEDEHQVVAVPWSLVGRDSRRRGLPFLGRGAPAS